MQENHIRGRVVIEFVQGPNGEVRPRLDVDDWVRHYADLSPDTMAVARVPEAVIAARILADMCHGAGIEKALEFAAAAVKKAEAMRKEIEDGKKPAAGANEDARDGSVH